MYYLILDPKKNSVETLEAYGLWLTVWSKTFKELGNSSLLNSDDFTRQDEVGALFDGDKCAGLSFFRYVSWESPITRHDSYFSAWTHADGDKLRKNGSAICISSYFTVAEEYRRTDVKHELMRQLIKRFQDSGFNAMTGTTRNDRKVNDLVYQHGFECIRAGAVMHGVSVDLTAYYRKEAAK